MATMDSASAEEEHEHEHEHEQLDYDVLIIGAGLSGVYALHRIRQLGFRVKVLEAGSAEGGTWYWWVPDLLITPVS